MKRLAAVLCLLLVMGCTTYWSPGQEDWDAFNTTMTGIKPGTPEDSVTAAIPKLDGSHRIGIVDVEEMQAEGYHQRVYWVGYYRQYLRRVCAITCINGVVDSIYKP